jgi:hypothetical protein
MVKQITIRPPRAPPTIAPVFIGCCWVEAGIGPDVEDTSAEVIPGLELDAGMEVVPPALAVACEVELERELLGTDEGGDGVVVATAALGTGKSVWVVASAPQAMYSKDWSEPWISTTVEQNWDCSLLIFSSRNTYVAWVVELLTMRKWWFPFD